MTDSRYVMRISLNVLNHMGLYLYSNTPAVLAEAIANAWDADATEVHVNLDAAAKRISVRDNGVGMDQADINDKFLYVGYRKRTTTGIRTAKGRQPMGRKGIGKLVPARKPTLSGENLEAVCLVCRRDSPPSGRNDPGGQFREQQPVGIQPGSRRSGARSPIRLRQPRIR